MNKIFNPFFINANLVINNDDIRNIEAFRKAVYHNIGNSYITYAFMKLVCGGVYDAKRINNIYDYDYNNESDIDYINNECTHVIFILQDHIRAYALEFPMYLLDFLKKINKPIITISLGSNNYVNGEYDNNFISRLSREKIYFLKELSNLTNAIGVRGYRTVEVLNKLGINNVEAVGCPSYYVRGRNRIVEKKNYDDFKLALGGRLFNTNIENISYILQDELPIIELLYFKNHQLSYSFHYDIDYIALSNKRYVSFSSMEDWENYLNNFTMYLGWRMHGAIVALNSGIPSIVINPDSRAAEMCELFKIPYMPHILKRPLIDAKWLYDYIDLGPMNIEYNKLYDNFISWLKKFGIEKQENNFDYIKQPSIKFHDDITIKENIIHMLNYKCNILKSNINTLNDKLNNNSQILKYKDNINKLAWWIPIKKLRDHFRNKMLNTDQTRPDQTRPDQTRPDQTRPNYYIC
uniref:polysaccharide pyruvyl transferase family protein n=1 Tax=uncultured Brachyspira sp. TaxID=221953 RepID=UPI0026086F7E